MIVCLQLELYLQGQGLRSIRFLFIFQSALIQPHLSPICCRGQPAKTVSETASRRVNDLLLEEQYGRSAETEAACATADNDEEEQRLPASGSRSRRQSPAFFQRFHSPARMSSPSVCDVWLVILSIANELQRRGRNLQPGHTEASFSRKLNVSGCSRVGRFLICRKPKALHRGSFSRAQRRRPDPAEPVWQNRSGGFLEE